MYKLIVYKYNTLIVCIESNPNTSVADTYIRGVETGTTGMALARPIFQGAQSKILALYMHTIMIFSPSHDPNGAKNGIIDGR